MLKRLYLPHLKKRASDVLSSKRLLKKPLEPSTSTSSVTTLPFRHETLPFTHHFGQPSYFKGNGNGLNFIEKTK